MNYFGAKSKKEILTLHIDLRTILNKAIEVFDFSVIEGIRTAKRQNKLFTANPPRTTLDGYTRKSKHQGRPCRTSLPGKDAHGNAILNSSGEPICSYAVDIVPYKKGINPWDSSELNLRRFYYMMGIIKATAERLLLDGLISHKIRFGLDWDSDEIFTDQSFHDLPHMELVEP